jgi:hypothetical protein
MDTPDVSYDFSHLRILFVAEERHYWNAISQMKSERIHVIIHNKDIFQVNAFENSEILNINLLIL